MNKAELTTFEDCTEKVAKALGTIAEGIQLPDAAPLNLVAREIGRVADGLENLSEAVRFHGQITS